MKRAVLAIFTTAVLVMGCQPARPPVRTVVLRVPVQTAAPADPFSLYCRHQYAAAVKAFARPGEGKSVDALLAVADCQHHLHHPADEFEALKQAVKQYPKSVPAWIALAHFEESVGRLDHTELALRRAIAVDPKTETGWCDLGLLRLKQHRMDEAIVCFNCAIGGAVPKGQSVTTRPATTQEVKTLPKMQKAKVELPKHKGR